MIDLLKDVRSTNQSTDLYAAIRPSLHFSSYSIYPHSLTHSLKLNSLLRSPLCLSLLDPFVAQARLGGREKWYGGVVVTDNGDSTFEVKYDDGDVEEAVDGALMRAPLGSPSKVQQAMQAAVRDVTAEDGAGVANKVAAAAQSLEHEHEHHAGEVPLGGKGIAGGDGSDGFDAELYRTDHDDEGNSSDDLAA